MRLGRNDFKLGRNDSDLGRNDFDLGRNDLGRNGLGTKRPVSIYFLWISHRKEIRKLTFRAQALRRSESKTTLPFKDQKFADSVRRQLSDLSKKIHRVLQPVFTSRKISEDLKITETKPSLVKQQCVVYEFQRNSCDSNYIGYTSRHLHLRIEEHKYSVIGKHLKDKHNQRPTYLHEQSTTLEKCRGKFECLIYEMLLIRKKRPTLNTQNDSIPAKLFI